MCTSLWRSVLRDLQPGGSSLYTPSWAPAVLLPFLWFRVLVLSCFHWRKNCVFTCHFFIWVILERKNGKARLCVIIFKLQSFSEDLALKALKTSKTWAFFKSSCMFAGVHRYDTKQWLDPSSYRILSGLRWKPFHFR